MAGVRTADGVAAVVPKKDPYDVATPVGVVIAGCGVALPDPVPL